MSLDPLKALVLDVVTRVGDDPFAVRTALVRELAARPRTVMMAWTALRALGARPRRRDLAEVSWALEVIEAALTALQLPASDESRRAAAHGLVDLLPHRTASSHDDP